VFEELFAADFVNDTRQIERDMTVYKWRLVSPGGCWLKVWKRTEMSQRAE